MKLCLEIFATIVNFTKLLDVLLLERIEPFRHHITIILSKDFIHLLMGNDLPLGALPVLLPFGIITCHQAIKESKAHLTGLLLFDLIQCFRISMLSLFPL